MSLQRAKIKNFVLLILSLTVSFTAGYILLLTIYPKIIYSFDKTRIEEEVMAVEDISHGEVSSSIGKNQKTLIIPKINLREDVHEGDETALEKGIWNKFPKRSPLIGGNFVLVGHRFNFGLTPEETKRKSPLYNVDQLQVGDEIIVQWEGRVYYYTITERKKVDPTQIEIERNSREDRLTLYTCTLGGRYDGREVVIAKPNNI